MNKHHLRELAAKFGSAAVADAILRDARVSMYELCLHAPVGDEQDAVYKAFLDVPSLPEKYTAHKPRLFLLLKKRT